MTDRTTHTEETYGIGRVPADVDAAREALAELEALELAARSRRRPTPTRPVERCSFRGCRAPATMGASLGPACPDHYDDLSA